MSTPRTFFALLHGEMQIPPNYTYQTVGTRGFPLAASYPVIERLVERSLNENLQGSGRSYTPIPTHHTDDTFLYMMVVSYKSMASTCPPFDRWGWMSQEEVVFAIPLLAWEGDTPTGVALYSPYCFVDNAWSMVTGNMIAGYQKGLASFQLQPHLGNPYPIQIATTVFTDFDPSTHLSLERWISVEPRASPRAERKGEVSSPFGPLEDLCGPGSRFEVDETILALLRKADRTGLYDTVQLLQVRDPYVPALAAYSEVVTFAVQVKPPYDGDLLDGAVIDIRSFDSLRVVESLGLKREQDHWLVPFLPYWFRCDFDLNMYPRPTSTSTQGDAPG
jgi:hypothetical protein